jgi:hypothetical protein
MIQFPLPTYLLLATLMVCGCHSSRPSRNERDLISEAKARAIADAYLAYMQAQWSDEFNYAQWGAPAKVIF